MGRLLLTLLGFFLAMVIFQMVIYALIIAGLIFRTKETVGLLLIGGTLTLLSKFPVIGLSLVAVLVVVGATMVSREKTRSDPNYMEKYGVKKARRSQQERLTQTVDDPPPQ